MGTYALTTTADEYVIEDPVSGHRYTVNRHPGHFCAEEFYPWAMDGTGRSTHEQVRDWFIASIEANGNTVT
jgi:hypothetical protein